MQARQTEMDKIVEQQQQTALILERVSARLDSVERWQQAEDRAKEREEARRDERVDKVPDQMLAKYALLCAAGTMLVYVLTFVSQHWKP